MELKEAVCEEFLSLYKAMGKSGNYTNLSSDENRAEVKAYLREYFKNSPYNQEEVKKLVERGDKVIFDFLDAKMTNGKRPLSFMDFHEEELRRELMA
jgi:hypothetical protein